MSKTRRSAGHGHGSMALALGAALGVAACREMPPKEASPPGAPAAAPSSSAAASSAAAPPDWNQVGVPRILADAERLRGVVESEAAREFLARAALLPRIETRKLLRTADRSRYYTESEAAALAGPERAALAPFDADEEVYYTTTYGSPLSYSRPIDILASRGAVVKSGLKVLDFGYGYIGHLRMLATMGMNVTGVEVNPLVRPLYSLPGDQGTMTGPRGEKGSVRLLHGLFPSDAAIVAEVGKGYDLVISKNVLKRGYLHPERPVADPSRLIRLGVSDEVAIRAFFDSMAPGGWFLIYNISPAPSPPDKPFVPFSDGRSPFTRAQWEAGGFEVVVFDKDDTEAVRVMGRALGWDQPFQGEPGMDLVNDLSVLYTLVRRPAAR